MTPYARSEWDRYAASGTWTSTDPYGLDLDGKPWCPSGFAQRYHAVGACRCAQMTDTDAPRPPETDTDPEPRDHYRRGDADLGCGLMVIIAAVAALAAAALLAWIAGRGR
ncbi:MAG: hypothetical protein KKE65_01965 [Actinobacteria bacterium]|nr:hypothetical protein [Actinomycetota bacterium]